MNAEAAQIAIHRLKDGVKLLRRLPIDMYLLALATLAGAFINKGMKHVPVIAGVSVAGANIGQIEESLMGLLMLQARREGAAQFFAAGP